VFRLGLTGSIATGKSTALEAFEEMGFPVFSSDAAVHDLYRNEAVGPIGRAFDGVVGADGIDRKALGAILVATPARMAELEAIVHPLVRARIADFLAGAEAGSAELAVVDIPLLFESGHDYGLDAVAVTWCDPEEQRRRVLARPGMSVEKLETLLARQMPQEEKKRRARFAIDTNGPVEATRAQIAAVAQECLEAERAGSKP